MKEGENKKTGFDSIGERIDSSEDDVGSIEAKIPEVSTRQAQTEPTNHRTSEVYTPSPKQKVGPSFRLSGAKVFWGVIALLVIISMFSQNNDKEKPKYASNSRDVSSTTPSQSSVPATDDDDTVTEGQYRCSRYIHNKAQELKPSLVKKEDIERQQRIQDTESDNLNLLKTQIDATDIDQYSQISVNEYNAVISDYNSRLEVFRINTNNLQSRIDNYNAEINAYNNYLMSNCKKAY